MKAWVLFLVAFTCAGPVHPQAPVQLPRIGIVSSMANDSLLRAAGYCCLVESTQRLLSPREIPNEQFESLLTEVRSLQVPLLAVNIFIPGSIRVVGPEVNEDTVFAYVEGVFRRASQAGIRMIIWGSGRSRSIPDGFDPALARQQFIDIAGKIAALAKKYDILIALENLNSSETNFINSLEEALAIVKAVNHDNLRLCADLYHMLKENESPEAIEKAGRYIAYCEVAEKANRTAPGVQGDDFRPYFRALKKTGYGGKVVIECRWDDLGAQAGHAREVLRAQLEDVFEHKE